jgi:hypothetical protein
MLHLSAGTAGLRNVLITIDAQGNVLSAGDTVLFQHEEPSGESMLTVYDIESLGGRFWPDGSFTGTRWKTRTEQDEQGQEATTSVPSSPSPEDVAAMNQLVAEMLRRAAITGGP